jgi:hypothetical protein
MRSYLWLLKFMILFQNQSNASLGAAHHEADTDSRDVFPVSPPHSCCAPPASPRHDQPRRNASIQRFWLFTTIFLLFLPVSSSAIVGISRLYCISPVGCRSSGLFSSDPVVAKPQRTQTIRTNTAQTSGVEKEARIHSLVRIPTDDSRVDFSESFQPSRHPQF